TFSFKISELVLPSAIPFQLNFGDNTSFFFPFNNPKKSPSEAYLEITKGLTELDETTLLFLSKLQVIRWKIDDIVSSKVQRRQHSEYHIEVLKHTNNRAANSLHFLRFSEDIEVEVKQHKLSIAFALDFLPEVREFNPTKPLAKQLKIVPSDPGRVAVFFPAEKETSGLRFHLHAPFVPELSRASIKETSANNPLFDKLAKLAAASLHQIRKLHLLTAEFLGVLPNPKDTIPLRYQPIRTAIIEEMNNESLTPTFSKSFAPAKHLLQAKAALKELLSVKDIEFLVDYDTTSYQWAISATQKNSNVDRFLAGLAIKDWDVDKFLSLLTVKLGTGFTWGPPYNITAEDVMTWLAEKSIEWHQQLYSFLYRELSPIEELFRLEDLKVIRLSNGSYSIGKNCYFPSEGIAHDEILPRVDIGVYTSGKNKSQKDDAKKLLQEIGVREVGEAEQVQAILKQRYTAKNLSPQSIDLERFISLIENDPEQAEFFASYYIFQGEDEKWHTPGGIYIDSPSQPTGLSAYFSCLGTDTQRVKLSESYLRGPLPIERILSFAEKVGVQLQLHIKKVRSFDNPAYQTIFIKARGGWSDSHGINEDFAIEGLQKLLPLKNKALSQLIWKTACEQKRHQWLKARYRNNSQQPTLEADSQVICLLKESPWIPQIDGRFVRPAEAERDLLPEGFPYDEGYLWLKTIEFGKLSREKRHEKEQKENVAKELGFGDAGSLERAKEFSTLPADQQERILAECRKQQQFELPEHQSRNPERRAVYVTNQAVDSPDRLTELRSRSVSINREDVKTETAQYLAEQYTNPDGEMICQICKAPLPFKLDNGNFYFEKVEFLPELKKHHFQNYLALCPNHRAMFQHVNGSKELLKDMLLDLITNELEVILARQDMTIYFTRTHIADLKTVIATEQQINLAEAV
ncbi:MAG: hypothetical protein JNM09_26370, partial [Blastocatellia bacterium]|nr:hypothetical protein [Blastocatellia bacterium]